MKEGGWQCIRAPELGQKGRAAVRRSWDEGGKTQWKRRMKGGMAAKRNKEKVWGRGGLQKKREQCLLL